MSYLHLVFFFLSVFSQNNPYDKVVFLGCHSLPLFNVTWVLVIEHNNLGPAQCLRVQISWIK